MNGYQIRNLDALGDTTWLSVQDQRFTGLGDLNLSFVDIGQVVRKLRALAPIRSSMQMILQQGQRALDQATQGVDGITSFGSAQDIARSAIARAQGGLDYYTADLATNSSDPYDKATDLKNRVVQAFEAYNMVVEGNADTQANEGQFLSDVWSNIVNLPENIIAAVTAGVAGVAGAAASGTLKGFFGALINNPIGVAVVGGAGAFILYKLYRKKLG